MFTKLASNILQELSDKCLLKSFACENKGDSEMYRKIAEKADKISAKIEVESLLRKGASKSNA